MSQIASVVLMPAAAVPQLRDATVPKKSWFLGSQKDLFPSFLREVGKEVVLDGSGYCCVMALMWLKADQIDLLKSEHEELTTFLSKSRNASVFALTPALREANLSKIRPESYSTEALTKFANDFNGTNDPDAGGEVLDAIKWIKKTLASVEDGKVGLLMIG